MEPPAVPIPTRRRYHYKGYGRICGLDGCDGSLYGNNLCRAHWLEAGYQVVPTAGACGRCGARVEITQACGVCGQRLCSDCYGPWLALACGACRTAAR